MASNVNVQDWETVHFYKKPTQNQTTNTDIRNAMNKGTQIESIQKPKQTHSKLHELDHDTETLSHTTVSHDLKMSIQKARLAKKMSQKELATQLNVKPDIISHYESGKAIPDNLFISKMEKILGCKLPRQMKK